MAKKRKFADGGNIRQPGEKIPFKTGSGRYDSETSKDSPYGIRGRESAARGLEMNAEGVRDAYESYKLPNDPDTRTLVKKIRGGDRTAGDTLRNAANADTSAYFTKEDSVRKALKAATPSADDVVRGYKKGGSVGGRGDGKAVRGRTKGRFV